MNDLMKQTHVDLTKIVCHELQSARHVIIAMDCWSKKGLTASFLAISAAFLVRFRTVLSMSFSISIEYPIHTLVE